MVPSGAYALALAGTAPQKKAYEDNQATDDCCNASHSTKKVENEGWSIQAFTIRAIIWHLTSTLVWAV
jgi:hypothetical protein